MLVPHRRWQQQSKAARGEWEACTAPTSLLRLKPPAVATIVNKVSNDSSSTTATWQCHGSSRALRLSQLTVLGRFLASRNRCARVLRRQSAPAQGLRHGPHGRRRGGAERGADRARDRARDGGGPRGPVQGQRRPREVTHQGTGHESARSSGMLIGYAHRG